MTGPKLTPPERRMLALAKDGSRAWRDRAGNHGAAGTQKLIADNLRERGYLSHEYRITEAGRAVLSEVPHG
jgi:hypothetical protein